eukprot:11214795-Lingulodinium_polyedra.AAC.1
MPGKSCAVGGSMAASSAICGIAAGGCALGAYPLCAGLPAGMLLPASPRQRRAHASISAASALNTPATA